MSRFELSLQARADLQEIEDYISRDNPDAAARLLQTIDEKCGYSLFIPASVLIGRNCAQICGALLSGIM